MSNFLSALQRFYDFAANANDSTEVEPCAEHIDHYKFYQFSLIPAILMCCLFAATKTRRQMLLSKLGGRPGLVYPMDTLTRDHSLSYACAFGVTGFVVYEILHDQQFAVEYTGPISLATLIAIISMFIYGIVFFPVFASLALGTAISYGLGALYVLMFFIIEVYKMTECEVDAKGRLAAVIRGTPNLFCLAYLSVSLPIRCVVAFRKKQFFSSSIEETKPETLDEIRESYQGVHVREILKMPVVKLPPYGKKNIIKSMLKEQVHRFIYQRKRGFEFPARLVSVMFVAGCVIYVVTVEFLVFSVTLFNLILNGFGNRLNDLKWDDQPGDSDDIIFERSYCKFGYHLTYVLKASTIVSITLASLMSLLTILHMMTSFRKNLFSLYKGDFRNIPPPSESSAMSLCVGSMKFAGYQVAYIFWAYMLSCVVIFIICIILAALILLLAEGVTDWLVNTVLQLWPSVLIAICLYVAQLAMARWVFLQGEGQHLRLDNRRFYFVFTYFMFFFNIFMGMASCLMRILKAIAIGTIFLARLDKSTLPRSFEFFDPGFSAYQGFIHMEAAHTHPVVNVFIRLLTSMVMERTGHKNSVRADVPRTQSHRSQAEGKFDRLQDSPSVERKRQVKDIVRFNWHVTYTLLNNPTVRIYRKGYIQALRKARAEGIKIPVSDRMFTDFDLVKSKEQKEKERLEELERIKALKLGQTELELGQIELEIFVPQLAAGVSEIVVGLEDVVASEKPRGRSNMVVSMV